MKYKLELIKKYGGQNVIEAEKAMDDLYSEVYEFYFDYYASKEIAQNIALKVVANKFPNGLEEAIQDWTKKEKQHN